MDNINNIMDMLDWHKPVDVQEQGRVLARSVECIDVFIQPLHTKYNKNVWDNCAMIISERNDAELKPYLIPLFEWLQDMNWPGAFCIYDRLKSYRDIPSFDIAINFCKERIKVLNDDRLEQWEQNLSDLEADRL